MSEGMPPPGTPPSPDQPPTGPPPESFQVKAQKLVEKYLMPPADPAQDTPEASMNRMLMLLVVIGIAIVLLFGCLFAVASIF